MKAAIISSAALAAVVAAAPTARTTGPSSTGVMFINGQQLNLNTPTAAHGPCTADDDVEQCAKKIAATWTLPGNLSTTASSLTWRGSCTYSDGSGQLGCQVTLPYTANFQNCRIQDPPVLTQLSQAGAFDCNSGGDCQFQMQFGTTSTNTTTTGYKVATQLTAEASIGIVSTSLQVSADFSQNWSGSQSSTTTETRTYTLQPGDVCNPTTVQFRTQCDTKIESSYTPQSYYHIPNPGTDMVLLQLDPDNRQIGTTQPLHLCSTNDATTLNGYDYVNDVTFEGKDTICAAMQNAGTVAIDVGALSGLGPWAIQGCMFT